MSGFSFRLDQEDADEFSFQIEDDAGCTWQIPMMGTMDAVALFEAVEACIGEYVREMRAARQEYGEQRLRIFDEGYALDDPKHPTYHERMSDLHDSREGK